MHHHYDSKLGRIHYKKRCSNCYYFDYFVHRPRVFCVLKSEENPRLLPDSQGVCKYWATNDVECKI